MHMAPFFWSGEIKFLSHSLGNKPISYKPRGSATISPSLRPMNHFDRAIGTWIIYVISSHIT